MHIALFHVPINNCLCVFSGDKYQLIHVLKFTRNTNAQRLTFFFFFSFSRREKVVDSTRGLCHFHDYGFSAKPCVMSLNYF